MIIAHFALEIKLLIRIPTAQCYALKAQKEKLAKQLSVQIPKPIAIGHPSKIFSYPFSIYQYLEGSSINLLNLNDFQLEQLAFDLAKDDFSATSIAKKKESYYFEVMPDIKSFFLFILFASAPSDRKTMTLDNVGSNDVFNGINEYVISNGAHSTPYDSQKFVSFFAPNSCCTPNTFIVFVKKEYSNEDIVKKYGVILKINEINEIPDQTACVNFLVMRLPSLSPPLFVLPILEIPGNNEIEAKYFNNFEDMMTYLKKNSHPVKVIPPLDYNQATDTVVYWDDQVSFFTLMRSKFSC
jgi:hypothetical protein